MDSPFTKLFAETPNYEKLRIFGCLCFPWLRPYNANKLENKSSPCVFLGYSLTQSAYLCLQPSSGRIYVSRHVKFDETVFPFHSLHKIESNLPDTSSSASKSPVDIIPIHQPLAPPSTALPMGSSTLAPHQTTSSANQGMSTPPQISDSETGNTEVLPRISPSSINPNQNINPQIGPNNSSRPKPKTQTQQTLTLQISPQTHRLPHPHTRHRRHRHLKHPHKINQLVTE